MNRIFVSLIVFLAVFTTFTFAQSGKSDSINNKLAFKKNEIGFDMVFFLNLFRSQYEPSNTTELMVNYDRWLTQKDALRFTWGIGFYNQNTKQDTLPKTTNKNSNNIFRLGYKREERVSKRWNFYYGVDAMLEYDYNQSQQLSAGEIITATDKNQYFGPVPFMGVRFEINSHISLTTETQVEFLFSDMQNKQEHSVNLAQNTTTTTKGFNISYIIPQNIFLKVKF